MKLYTKTLKIQPEVTKLYEEGWSVQKLAAHFKTSKAVIRRCLAYSDVTIRSQSEQQLINNGSSSLKHDAFNVLTEESLYWIGFLYADGYVSKNGNRHLITLDISTSDRLHLEKFKLFLNAGVSIRDYVRKRNGKEYKTSMISISSKVLYERLTELGFTTTKTYDGRVHSDLINHPAFWRGVFDGDGWISSSHSRKYKTVYVGLCGTKDTIQAYIDFLKRNGVDTKVSEARFKKGTKNNYETNFINTVGKQVLDLLYKDATVYLDRKYQTYLTEFCEQPAAAA